MKRRKVMKWLAAMAFGAAMLLPMASSAATWRSVDGIRYWRARLDSTVPVMGLTASYVEGYGEGYETGVVVHWASAVPAGYTMCLECSTESGFANEERTRQLERIEYDQNGQRPYSDNEELYTLSAGTNYVRAVLYKRAEDNNGEYLAYNVSRTVEVSVPAPDAKFEKTVSSTKVKFKFSSDDVTGYEIRRKVGSKFVKIAKISDQSYTDAGLQKNKTYNYKIRTYVYNPSSKKTVYGDWAYTEATTWGNLLNLKAVPGTKSTTVKLTWSKVSGASGYEIYRSAGKSTVSAEKSFSNMKLIRTITNAKTQKYTDTGLIAGNSYRYTVVAYKNQAGKKVKDLTVSDSASVSLGLYFDVVTNVENKDGSRKITWKKAVGAKGFKIMKKEQNSGKWVVWKTLKASARSVKLPASAAVDAIDYYQIYAYAGAKKSNIFQTYTRNYSPRTSPGGIKATVVNGGTAVKVSWRAVTGAAYYRVYRSTSLPTYASTDLGNYYYNGRGTSVYIAKQSGEEWDYRTDKITTTSVTDEYIPYTNPKDPEVYCEPVNQGPELGMTYYYYVQAYRSDGKVLSGYYDGYYDEWDNVNGSWYGYYGSFFAKPARVTLSRTVSLKAPKLSSVKSAKKGQATVTWKSVKGAKTYYVYCATSKKAKNYMCVGTTTKKSLTVKGLNSRTTYYFKVKAAVGNEMGADTNMSKKFSSVKSVKVK